MAARLRSLSSSIARWHADERTVGSPLNDAQLVALRRTRLFGATGTVLMAIGALGAGARPVVQDPSFGVRLLNLPSRIQTVSLTMTTTGAVMMALAWLMLGRFALGSRRMSRSQLDRTLLLWALPLADRAADVQQGRLLVSGAERDLTAGARPVSRRARHRTRPRPRLHAVGAQPVAGNARTLRTAVPVDGPRDLGHHRREHRRGRAVPSPGRAGRYRADRVGHPSACPALRRGGSQRTVAGPGEPAAVHAPGRGHPQRSADARPDVGGHRVRAARDRSRQVGDIRHRRRSTRPPAAGLAARSRAAGRAGIRWPCSSWAPC